MIISPPRYLKRVIFFLLCLLNGCVTRPGVTRDLDSRLVSSGIGSTGIQGEDQGRHYFAPIIQGRFLEFLPRSNVEESIALPPLASVPPVTDSNKGSNFTQFTQLVFFVKSERWFELLQTTSGTWESCLVLVSRVSDTCREIGRARALAHVRLGQFHAAWKVSDHLGFSGLTSVDAMLFASLYLEVGAVELCASLSNAGLNWEPSNARLELSALRAKCLRLSGQFREARKFINRSLIEFPHESSLLLESALIFFSENNLTQGCDILERLYLKRTRQVAVVYNWGQCLLQRKDADAASQLLSRAQAEWPSERVWIILSGEVAFLEGRFGDARQLGLDYLASADASDSFRAQAERLSRIMSGEK